MARTDTPSQPLAVGGRPAASLAARLLLGLVLLVAVGWAAGELWVASIGGKEADLMRELASERGQAAVDAARVVTWLGSLWLLIPVGLVACVLLLRAKLFAETIALAVGLLGAILIYNVTKGLVARPRPPVEHLQKVGGFSFPSGHATQASAFWLSLLLAFNRTGSRKRRAAAAAVIAIVGAVAWSRVYLGVHYPSDVVAGVALGSAWALYVARCLYAGRASAG